MNITQTIRMAFKSIAGKKMRSFLTMLGIIIGVAAVIVIVATIQGASRLLQLQMEAMGSNQIVINGITTKDAWNEMEAYLDTTLKDQIAAWSPQDNYYDWQSKGLRYRSKTLSLDSTQVFFGNESYGFVTSNSITVGRDLSEADLRNSARVCVIGETVRKSFFGAMSPLGQYIRLGGMSFEVVGVYKGKFGGKLNTPDQMVLLPYSLINRMMGSAMSASKTYYVRAKTKDDITPVMNAINQFMSTRYDQNNGYFNAYSDAEWQQQSEASNNILALVGGGVAGISLLVGGIGIMNIMLVTVTERTREIGIRMAIGARKRDIISQFLIEAAVVSCMGGVIGILIGCLLSAAFGTMMLAGQMSQPYMPQVEHFTVLPSLPLVIGAFLFSALLGILFGLYPANKASNLQPVDALRTQ